MPRKMGLTLTIGRVRSQTITVLQPVFRAPCSICRREVEALSRSQAQGVLGIQDWAFDELLAHGDVHAIPTRGQQSWVCKDSLFKTSGEQTGEI